ncbi:acetylcholine receptor subunit alpha-like 2 [Macrosteles quadrilineatus]|uniref:acetylcholine receptor subunit alpha-like 2 n=1 Tax=Macrosteles quadrilineatus TaxID=74068 RepID=UPI0023E1A160|nr:acetylcholine receptor subunit alpha-like 2 [Macrosteles quadrilineatus]
MWRVYVCLLVGLTVVLGDPPPSSPTPPANGVTHLWNATWTDHLKHDLLMKYDKFARPAQHTNATEVQFGLVIRHVEVDEVRSMMILNAWTKFEWDDEKLKWNASDYGGLKILHVADHEIWQPDIVLYNSALGNSVDHYGNTHCLVYPTGHVLWVPPSQFSAYCDINLRKWPYDRHTCHFFFGSWVYDGEQVLLKRQTSRNTSDGEVDPTPMQWKVVSVIETEHVKYYACCSEPYYNIEVVVTVERKNPAYAAVIFTPAIVCVILTLAVFWLPPHASEKFLVAGATAVIECMFLLYFAQKLPAMGQHIPLIVEFYGYSLALMSVSVVVSVVTVNISRRPAAHPVPWIISGTLNRYAIFLGLLNNKNAFVSVYGRQDCEELHERNLVDRGRTESVDTTHQPTSAQTAREWVLLANAIDRFMFLIYVVIFLLIGASFYLS